MTSSHRTPAPASSPMSLVLALIGVVVVLAVLWIAGSFIAGQFHDLTHALRNAQGTSAPASIGAQR